jgi:predicted nucleotidyltransferase component of viral defense system
MNWFELAIEDRRLLLQQASTVSGINAKALEKDLWVTLVLLAVFKTTCASSLHFKGGTSLSKAWQVIDRFSEDIDLSIDRSFYGFAEELSFTQIRKLKRISSEFVSTAFKADLENTLLEMGVPRQVFTVQATPIPPTRKDTVDPQELVIAYVSILENVDYLPNTIKVELSARAIKDASHLREVNSLLENALPQVEVLANRFEVSAMAPQITLLEKVFLLHEEFTKHPAEMRHLRMSRHLYDLYRLSESKFAESALQDIPLFERIAAHRKHYIRQAGIDYTHHGRQSLSCIPPDHLLDHYRGDYEKMTQNMIYGKAPSFAEMLHAVAALQATLALPTNASSSTP